MELTNIDEIISGQSTANKLLEAMAESVIIIDRNGKILFVNNNTYTLFGFSKADIIGKPLNIILPVDKRLKHEKNIVNYFNEPHRRPMGRELDLVGLHKDGAKIPIEVSLSHINTNAGMVAFAFITDNSLRKAAEERLRAFNEELKQTNKRLSAEIELREEAEKKIDVLSGLLPICASCKKIRDEHGGWEQVEEYISKNSEAEFSHSVCPDCTKQLYAEILNPS